IGRALVWETDCGKTFMDRVYTSYDWLDEKFIEYAKEQGWWTLEHYNDYKYKTRWVDPAGVQRKIYAKISLDTDFESYPYLDTFTYGKDGFISNDRDDTLYEYTETDGTRVGDGMVYDEVDNEYI